MKYFLLLILAFLLSFKAYTQKKRQGIFHQYSLISNGDYRLSYTGAHLHFLWSMSTLYGEPVLKGTAYIVVDKPIGSYINVVYKGSTYKVPSSYLSQIEAVSVELKGVAKYNNKKYQCVIDGGVPNKLYIGNNRQFKQLSSKEKSKYASLNVPSSPSWKNLFKPIYKNYYVEAKFSKKIWKSMSGLLKPNSRLHNTSQIKVKWNLSKIKNYIIEQAISENTEEAIQSNSDDDFWSTSSKSESKKQQNKYRTKSNKSKNKFAVKKDDFWSTTTSKKSLSKKYIKHKKKGKYGFVTKSGKTIIPHIYERIENFSEGLAAAKKNGKWGFINYDANWVIQPKYISVTSFKNGMSKVTLSRNSKTYSFKTYSNYTFTYTIKHIIDQNGKCIKKQKYYSYKQAFSITLNTSNVDESYSQAARRRKRAKAERIRKYRSSDDAKFDRIKKSAEDNGYKYIK